MTITPKTLWLGMALMLAGCTSPEPPAPKDREPGKYQGRDDTQSLRNADAVGYDGAAIQEKQDAALDKNEQRAADLDQQIEAQSGDAETQEQR
jgi:hypothetical protein